MRVNIILESGDTHWIGGRLARELASRLPKFGIETSINGSHSVDLTYHQIVYNGPIQRPAVGLFTHGRYRPQHFGPAYDGQISMNPVMHRYLMDAGCEWPIMIHQPIGDEFIRKTPICFGVAGRVYGDGRKGEHLVRHMLEEGFTVYAWGYGWPEGVRDMGSDPATLPEFYHSIDYYIDTSSDEGGCTPALEARAMGVPVISHSIGVDRPCLFYETHSWESLHAILNGLSTYNNYDQWAEAHALYFHSVIERFRKGAAA